MRKRLSTLEVKEILSLRDYELVTKKYLHSQQKLIIKDKLGYFYFISFNNFNAGRIPCKFHQSNPYTIQNIKLWCKLNNKSFKLISEVYINSKIKLEWQCLKDKCKEIFKSSWNSINRGDGCGYCEGLQVGISNCLATINPVLSSEWHKIYNNNLTPWDVTRGSRKSIWWQCKECNHEWEAEVRDRSNGRGCPECNKSKGEKRIKEIFIKDSYIEILQEEFDKLLDKYNNTYFILQKEFEGLIGTGGGLLSYDFYLPKYNLLIECQGEFHDGNVGKNIQSKKDYEKQVEHDRRKKEYAQKNNYNFLEIWYWDFDNIEEILVKYFKLIYK